MHHETPYSTGSLDTALDLHRKGLRLIPLLGKRAIVKDWPVLTLSEDDIRVWSGRGVNWGVLTGDSLVVLDTDTDQAEAWVQEHGIDSPVVVRSGGRGLHRYFRCPAGCEIHSRSAVHGVRGLDMKGWRSYIVAVGSVHPETQRRYAYLPGRELGSIIDLPAFDPRWIEELREEPAGLPTIDPRVPRHAGHIRDLRAYIRAIPSIEGEGGDKACFTVACILVGAGLGFDDALAEFCAWNETNAFPHWQTAELCRKLRYASARIAPC